MDDLRARFIDVFVIARGIINDVERAGVLQFPVPVKAGILVALQAQLGDNIPIELSRRDWRADQLYSALFRYRDKALIIYSADLNPCWRRFAVCKEAAHLLIDNKDEHMTTDVASLIQQLITDAPINIAPESPIESESMGVVVALELLLPWKIRGQLIKMAQEGKTDREIADYAKVPQKYVNVMLRSGYGTLSARFNRELDESDRKMKSAEN